MMTLEQIETLARTKMDEHGLSDWSFGWDQSTVRAGCCHNRQRRISMSKPLFSVVANQHDEANILDVILHEIAHALVPPESNHGPVWKAKAIEIGAKPEKERDMASVPPRYVSICPCGLTHESQKLVRGICAQCRRPVLWQAT